VTLQHADDLKKRLTDEYKILQDKIDKIGAFRFTIKGWAVAAVGASTAAASGARDPATAIFVTVGLAISVVFLLFEVEQVRQSRLFGFLAGQIEQVFDDIDNERLRRSFPSPIIATEIVTAKKTGIGRIGSGGGWCGVISAQRTVPRGSPGGAKSKKTGQLGDRPTFPSTCSC